jgi:hypothetical protein
MPPLGEMGIKNPTGLKARSDGIINNTGGFYEMTEGGKNDRE